METGSDGKTKMPKVAKVRNFMYLYDISILFMKFNIAIQNSESMIREVDTRE